MLLGLISIPLLTLCVVYLQVIQLTTPFRNRNIGTLPGLAYQDVTLTAADGNKVSGWYVPGSRPQAIILVHGIHANRAYLAPQAQFLAEAGYHLLLIDLRGHGRSEGARMTYGYRESLDVLAGVDYLAQQPEVAQIGALGHSLGAAAMVKAAAIDPRLEAIVVQSSYSSLPQAVEDTFENFVLLPRWPFAPLIVALAEYRTGVEISQVDSARDLGTMPSRPVFIIHNKGDNLFLLHHAQKMYNSAQQPKSLWVVDGMGHVNPFHGHEAEYKTSVLNFFRNGFNGIE